MIRFIINYFLYIYSKYIELNNETLFYIKNKYLKIIKNTIYFCNIFMWIYSILFLPLFLFLFILNNYTIFKNQIN